MKIDFAKVSAGLIIVLALLMYSSVATETTWRHSGFELWGYDINFTNKNATNMWVLDFEDNGVPGLSDVDNARLYYNDTDQKLKLSVHGGGYATIGSLSGSVQGDIDTEGYNIWNGTQSIENYDYLIYNNGSTVVAKNGATGAIDYNNNDIARVYNYTIGSNRHIVIKQGVYDWSTAIIIPNGTHRMTTEGLGQVRLNSTIAGTMISLTGGFDGTLSTYKKNFRLRFDNIYFRGNNIAATALNLSQPEQSMGTIIEKCEFETFTGDAVNLNGNEDSYVRNCIFHSGALQWHSPQGNGHISDTYFGSNIDVSGQLIIIENCELLSLSYSDVIASTTVSDELVLNNVYFNHPATISSLITVNTGLESLIISNIYAHQNNSNSVINTSSTHAITQLVIIGGALYSKDGSATPYIDAKVTNIIATGVRYTNGAKLGSSTSIFATGIDFTGKRVNVYPTGSDKVWYRLRTSDSNMYYGLGEDVGGNPVMSLMGNVIMPISAPAYPQAGSFYLDQSTNRLYIYSSGAWKYEALT